MPIDQRYWIKYKMEISMNFRNNDLLIRNLRSRLIDVWGRVLAPRSQCALILFPDHWNVGDSAIWWGTRRVFAELEIRVAYACDPWSYNPKALQAALPEGQILLLGGGNFGDVYPPEAELRASILRDFEGREIVQLPQSIWFKSPASVRTMAESLSRHGKFTLLARDEGSAAFGKLHFPSTRIELCPDSAFALDLSQTPRNPCLPVLALWRTDGESAGALPALPTGWQVSDWEEPMDRPKDLEMIPFSTAMVGFREWIGPYPSSDHANGKGIARRKIAWRFAPWLWDQLAEERTVRGLNLLSKGKVVLTNRLHVHILCLLAGIPHVVCDTSNGKIFAFRKTWLEGVSCGSVDPSTMRFADTPEQAIEAAHSLLSIC